jgi:class 3 adenylate cyclase/tetratricopeptide (TPR) repeat protein
MDRSDWQAAFEQFAAVDAVTPLAAADLDQLALAAWWTGDPDAAQEYLLRGFAAHTAANDTPSAVRCAIELCIDSARRDKVAVALGWMQRAERLLEGCEPCAELGRLEALKAAGALDVRHDPDAAIAHYETALRIGEQCGDTDLIAEAKYGIGSVLIRRGQVDEGMRLIDEVMIDAVSGLLSPMYTARVYCGTISTCQAIGDIRRASEWTTEAAVCSTRPGMGDLPGDCQAHRAEMTRLRGDWATAEAELRRVMETLGRWSPAHVGQAWYVIGEIAIMRGDLTAAEDAFVHAEANQKQPQPARARLRLMQGDDALAAGQIRAALAAASEADPMAIAELLPTAVEIHLACADIESATAAAARLSSIATLYDTVLLQARAATSGARVALANRDGGAAALAARVAISLWRDADAPFEAAQGQHLLAQAALLTDERDVAIVELDAAITVFEGLGAGPDLEAARRLRDRIGDIGVGHEVRRTFMFTDIVDSTRLLAGMGDARWAAVLRAHDRLIRDLLVAHGGSEVKQRGGGDGFFAVFDEPVPAIACAIAIQRGFARQRDDAGFAPEVRIGVHEAVALLSGGDYAGLGVHEAARIAGVAAAGDILTSAATATSAGLTCATPVRNVAVKGLRDEIAIQAVDWESEDA